MSNSTPRKGLKRQVGLSLFSAIIVVLTVLGNFVRFGPVPITLSLAPIIIGAAVYGSSAGALLGGVFGLVVLLGGIFGWDGGTVMLLMGLNPIGCILICIGKGILAGYLSGLAYARLRRKAPSRQSSRRASCARSSIRVFSSSACSFSTARPCRAGRAGRT